MKNLKRGSAIVCAAAVLCAGMLVSCGEEKFDNDYLMGTATLVVKGTEEKSFQIELTNRFTREDSVEDVLNSLVEEGKLYYEGQHTQYGLYLTEVGYPHREEGATYDTNVPLVKQDTAAGKYVYLYTSITDDQDTSEYKSEITYGEQTLVSAAVGISSMHIRDEAVICIAEYIYTA